MATPWTPAQRIAAYRAEGITRIVEMPGWKTHNRDDETGRAFGPVYGMLIHHTAGVGPGQPAVIRGGVAGLPGPLAHDFLAKDGTLYVAGHGRTNHAGKTTPAVRDAIISELAPAGQRDLGDETVDGNDFLYGLEIENRGDSRDPYPEVQYDVAVRWAAATCRHHGWGMNSVWGHKEITRRKIDPSFPMLEFRRDVDDRLNNTPIPPVEDDMDPVDVWAYKGRLGAQPDPRDTYAYLRDTEARTRRIEDRIDQLETTGLTDQQMQRIADLVADRMAARLAN